MTDQQHPITPPPELVEQWDEECDSRNNSEIDNTFDALQHFASKAARWGADQELEACCEWVAERTTQWSDGIWPTDALRAVRRPNPPSLKEQALAALATADGADQPVVCTVLTADQHAIIRRALESLPSMTKPTPEKWDRPTPEELRQIFDDHAGLRDDTPTMWWVDFRSAAKVLLYRWGK